MQMARGCFVLAWEWKCDEGRFAKITGNKKAPCGAVLILAAILIC
jgi:hypothetical protein